MSPIVHELNFSEGGVMHEFIDTAGGKDRPHLIDCTDPEALLSPAQAQNSSGSVPGASDTAAAM